MNNDRLSLPRRVQAFTMSTVVSLALAAGACTARVDTVHPVAADDDVYVDAAPRIDTAPHAVYQGQTVYYVDGHWYRPRGRGWTYYRNEPPELVRQRSYVQAAPPVYRNYHEGRGGGPHAVEVRPAEPGPAHAPDAVRVQ